GLISPRSVISPAMGIAHVSRTGKVCFLALDPNIQFIFTFGQVFHVKQILRVSVAVVRRRKCYHHRSHRRMTEAIHSPSADTWIPLPPWSHHAWRSRIPPPPLVLESIQASQIFQTRS